MSILVIGMAGTEGYLLAAIYACDTARIECKPYSHFSPISSYNEDGKPPKSPPAEDVGYQRNEIRIVPLENPMLALGKGHTHSVEPCEQTGAIRTPQVMHNILELIPIGYEGHPPSAGQICVQLLTSTHERLGARISRRILDKLHEHVMRIRNSVPENGHIDLHDLDSVEHVMNFDFEHLNEKAVPPLYFEPMQPVELKQFPPDPAQVRSFFDIIERGNDDSSCCRQISDLISDYATRNALSHQHLQIVEAPDSTFYLEASLAWPYSGRGWWEVCYVLEPEPMNGKGYPHLALHLLDRTVAHEDSIFSEFSALVIAMRGRVHQPKIDSESEREELYEHEDAGEEYTNFLPMSCSAMFPDEEIFPVLLISCVLPQHARIFAACIHQGKLVIRQSKLYSFQWRDKAPVELFTRLFLSSPVDTRGETHPELFRASNIPLEADEWIKAARAYNLTGNTLCTSSNLLSGSKVSKEQFLLYRIVCPARKKPRELDLTWFGSDAYRHYLHNIQNGDWANPTLGVFGPALRLQAEIWKGWNSKRVDATDEDTVNSALIELLNALTSTSTDGSADGMYRHYLASQCGTQIFVNSLVYQKKWIDYLQTGQNTDAFATLQSYGPYYIDSIRDQRIKVAPSSQMNSETRQRGEEHDQEGTITKKLPMQLLVNIVVMFMLAFWNPTRARDRTIAPMASRAISSTPFWRFVM
ncbi:hypothetical protein M752DRAFT_308893 [Aspergillus phoenicis ATCC 13157]|uniref:Uncharacterized protein n=1 Tax=Aspergillus phoenicis ATCC 13157 TaxID=1353007 RepID=A0A370P6M3_ASPPH|nr:hypothetical protein M752DRAFT_308893 [Aspergillus phoenicis ATCC 13157]